MGVVERIVQTIERYRMFSPGDRAGVAVSGGADSVCLLHVLVELAPRWALKLSVLHLDHQLRGEESKQDAEFVREMAGRLGLPVYVEARDVCRLAEETSDNLEQAARRARREFFLGFLEKGVLDRVALGHTRSDQAETVLFRLLRGSGSAGIAGIRPVTAEGFVRPLLAVDREEVAGYLGERGLRWREDSSNKDPRFARNRIRHELLPLLQREWNPRLTETLARMAMVAQEEEDYWRAEIERLAAWLLIEQPPAVLVHVERLAELPRPVGRRLVRQAFERVKGDLRGVEFLHVEQVLTLAEEREGSGRMQAPGLDVMRSFDWIRISPQEPRGKARNYRLALPVPGTLNVPGTGAVLHLELLEIVERDTSNPGYNTDGCRLDWSRISGPLELRNWRPGDHYRPVGHAGEVTIKSLFQNARVPLWERRSWPVITSGENILWARQFGPAAEYAATPESRLVVRVAELGDFVQSKNPMAGDPRLYK